MQKKMINNVMRTKDPLWIVLLISSILIFLTFIIMFILLIRNNIKVDMLFFCVPALLFFLAVALFLLVTAIYYYNFSFVFCDNSISIVQFGKITKMIKTEDLYAVIIRRISARFFVGTFVYFIPKKEICCDDRLFSFDLHKVSTQSPLFNMIKNNKNIISIESPSENIFAFIKEKYQPIYECFDNSTFLLKK